MVEVMRYRNWLSITILLVHIQHDSAFDDRYCAKSLETMSNVQMCPSTKTEMEEAAKRKDCVSHAKNQTCSEPWKFKYHCVMNVFRNESIEVCAPERKINGYCAEFNVEGARIQDHYHVDCTTLTPPCPHSYKSTDAYLYPVCYMYNNSRTCTPVKGISVESDRHDFPKWVIVLIVLTFLIVLSVLILIITFFVIFTRRRRGKHGKQKKPGARNGERAPLDAGDIEVSSGV